MPDDKPMKSSYELAMERLRKKDQEAGVEAKPVSETQKAAIAEIRNFYEAKMAEQDRATTAYSFVMPSTSVMTPAVSETFTEISAASNFRVSNVSMTRSSSRMLPRDSLRA